MWYRRVTGKADLAKDFFESFRARYSTYFSSAEIKYLENKIRGMLRRDKNKEVYSFAVHLREFSKNCSEIKLKSGKSLFVRIAKIP